MRIEAELEKDPDAIEDDIRKMVLMEKQTKKGINMDETMNTTQAKRNFKAPAITLGTVMATTETEAIGADGITK